MSELVPAQSRDEWITRFSNRLKTKAYLADLLSVEMARSNFDKINGDLSQDPEAVADVYFPYEASKPK